MNENDETRNLGTASHGVTKTVQNTGLCSLLIHSQLFSTT